VAAGRRRLTPGGTAVAAATVVVLVGSALSWAIWSYDAGQRHRTEDAAARATLSTLDRRTQAIAQLIAGPVEGLGVLSAKEIPAVIGVNGRPDGAVSVASGVIPDGLDATRVAKAARTAMEVTRDSGNPIAAPLTDGYVPLVVAVVPGAGGGSLSTEQRRTRITGWRVALVSPSGLLAGLPATSPLPAGLRVDGQPVGDVHSGAVAGTILVSGQPWTLFMGRPPTHVSRGALGVLGMALLGGLACLLSDIRVQRTLAVERMANVALERETRTVAELGPLLQSSLDLAEVLPAVALRLADEFSLSRFSVELVGEQGQLLEVFALGGRSRTAGDEIDVTPGNVEELPAGQAGCLPLLRAGRTIGRLSFTGHRPLGHAQLAALSAASDLIAVATYNVELFEREQASVRRLRDLDHLKDAFLSTISHELRTPLTAISGFVRLLRDRWDQLREDQRKEFLDRVHGNTLSLGLLVDDLLDFARLERQALNAPPTPMDLDQQVAKTLAQLAPVLGSREVVSQLEPVRALANAGALERVLANLLTNAAKFSPADSCIVVSVRRQSDGAVVEVADQGAGIAAEDRERVFARFYRGESDAARGTRGAGIGLSVVRELVQQMGGTVVAMPNTPRGTRMVVRLPLEDAAIAAIPSPNGRHLQAQRSVT
jgi:signal transduction histidine kinase